MSRTGDYDSELNRLVQFIGSEDFDLGICEAAKKFGKQTGEIEHDLQKRFPVQYHSARGSDRITFDGVAAMIADFGVTDDDVAGIKTTECIYRDVFPGGHALAIVGLSGAGKTTIMEHVCSQIEGQVLYINADISASDIPEAQRRAKAGGYALLCPDLKVGKSLDDVLKHLQSLAASDADLTGTVFVIDTLKKFTDLINKARSAETYKLLRALTGRGATVICLGHCNKYPDPDGWPVYEGTGDLRSDFDELGLLHAHKGDYGVLTVSLYWDAQGWPSGKTRAVLQPQSWEIDRENGRTVRELDDWVDTVALSKEYREALQTSDVIREVYHLLQKNGPMTQSEIIQRLSGIHGKFILRRVLTQQADKAWTIKIGDKNAHLHEAIPGADVPKPKIVEWGQR